MLKEFKEFAFRGSVINLAVALIMGLAFGKIVASLVGDIIMPPIGLLLGKVDFANLFVNLSGAAVTSVAAAKAAGVPTINYGVFINTVIQFLIVAIVMFGLAKMVSRFSGGDEEAEDKRKEVFEDHLRESATEVPEAEAEAPSGEAPASDATVGGE